MKITVNDAENVLLYLGDTTLNISPKSFFEFQKLEFNRIKLSDIKNVKMNVVSLNDDMNIVTSKVTKQINEVSELNFVTLTIYDSFSKKRYIITVSEDTKFLTPQYTFVDAVKLGIGSDIISTSSLSKYTIVDTNKQSYSGSVVEVNSISSGFVCNIKDIITVVQ